MFLNSILSSQRGPKPVSKDLNHISVSISLNSFFIHHLTHCGASDNSCKVISSVGAGATAGAVATLSELVAQTQQLSKEKLKARTIIKQGYQANGLFSLTRGSAAMVGRSAIFTAGYISMMPLLSQAIKKETNHALVADISSAIICGAFIGTLTAFPNVLRFYKQTNFTIKSKPPTYANIIKNAYTTNGIKALFPALAPRIKMAIVSMFILSKGNQLCELHLEKGFPDFPSFGRK